MPMIVRNKYGPIVVARCYFSKPEPLPRCDVIHLRHVGQPMAGAGWKSATDQTLLIDLEGTEEALLGAMNEGTRYEVRRAEKKDGFEVRFRLSPNEEEIREFVDVYNAFAATKSLPRVSLASFMDLRRQQALSISGVYDGGQLLACHQYLVVGGRARLALSGRLLSQEGPGQVARLARANRLLHWHDIKRFKEAGLKCYDFGGVCLDERRPELSGIDRFKMGFGGVVVDEFKCVAALTVGGRIALLGLRCMEEMRRLRRRGFFARRGPGSDAQP